MSYHSYVGAAIGGTPEQIRKFVNLIKSHDISDDSKLLDRFKIIDFFDDITLFAFYDSNFNRWDKTQQYVWDVIAGLANAHKLSYVFHRVGEGCTDYDTDSNSNAKYFIDLMNDLFEYDFCLNANSTIHYAFTT